MISPPPPPPPLARTSSSPTSPSFPSCFLQAHVHWARSNFLFSPCASTITEGTLRRLNYPNWQFFMFNFHSLRDCLAEISRFFIYHSDKIRQSLPLSGIVLSAPRSQERFLRAKKKTSVKNSPRYQSYLFFLSLCLVKNLSRSCLIRVSRDWQSHGAP